MNQMVQLKNAKLPKMLAELTHSNQFLKVFSLSSLCLAILSLLVCCLLTGKAPIILPLNQTGESIESIELPKAEDQIRAAIKRYLDVRYKWEPTNVKQHLQMAEAFVLPSQLKPFQSSVANVAKFSTEKVVSQKVYPENTRVDLEKKVAFITGDRITSIQGMKAAGDLKLELSFESGPRTKENPWGLYITKEKEGI